jgi:transposase-like protein
MMFTTGTGRGKRITPAGRREIIRRVVEGEKQQDIAADLDIMARTVAKVCAQQHMPFREHRSHERRAIVADLIRQGYTSTGIMRHIGVCRTTIERVRREIGMPARIGRPPRDADLPRLQDITLEPVKREPRPIHWGKPKTATHLQHLVTGRTPWVCYCTEYGVRATGPTCPRCGTAAPWSALLEAA